MRILPARIKTFREQIYTHYFTQGRILPWRETNNPYEIFVSEVMLQQTQVSRVRDKYAQFFAQFPSVADLAASSLQSVLSAWQGLGYNRRACALRRSAQIIVTEEQGIVPNSVDRLLQLPGIGYASACAICAFAFNQPVVFLETNIRSVYLHCFFKERQKVSDKMIIPLVAATLDTTNPRQWYYALMDYGVFLKNNEKNPGRRSAEYRKQSKFQDSNRQIRGRIIKLFVTSPVIPEKKLGKSLPFDNMRIKQAISQLIEEGFLAREKGNLKLED